MIYSTRSQYFSLFSSILLSHSVANPIIETDVVVVGGGFSGLTSAYDLAKAGLKTIVLEARDTIGGRSRSIMRQSGAGIIELGATWINNVTQPEVYALTQEFGLDTSTQYTDGDSVYEDSADASLQTEDPELAQLLGGLLTLIETTALSTDLHNFTAFPEDQDVTFAEWVALQNETLSQIAHIRDTVTHLSAQLVGRQAHEVGAHYLLDYIGSGGGLISLGSETENGAQFLKVKQGTTAIAQSLADSLEPGSVHVSSPVEAITHCGDHVVVSSSTGQLYQAKKVIMANPTNTYSDILFQPALPSEKMSLVSNTMPGVYAKLILSYSESWWRDAGLSGEFTSFIGPVCFSWDTSDVSLEQYSLAIFVAGDVATEWHALPDEATKQAAVVEHLAQIVGNKLAEKARSPIEINMAEWTLQDYIGGAPTSSMGPGMLRQYGDALREPFKNIHFGGGETAFEWKGYLEGAVRAGQRVAQEVIVELGGQSD